MIGTLCGFGSRHTCQSILVYLVVAILCGQLKASEERALCWRGKPLPHCKSFLLTEFGLYGRLSISPEPASFNERELPYATVDLGWMKNVSHNYAVGATLYGGADEEVVRLGIRARVRRWVEPNLALDLMPGIVVAGSQGGYNYPGFTGQLAVSFGDWASLATQVEIIPIKRQVFIPPNTFAVREGNETVWYAGVKLGSYPGAVASVVVPLVILAVVSASLANGVL